MAFEKKKLRGFLVECTKRSLHHPQDAVAQKSEIMCLWSVKMAQSLLLSHVKNNSIHGQDSVIASFHISKWKIVYWNIRAFDRNCWLRLKSHTVFLHEFIKGKESFEVVWSIIKVPMAGFSKILSPFHSRLLMLLHSGINTSHKY